MKIQNLRCLICYSKDHSEIFNYQGPDQYEISVEIPKDNYYRKWVQCTRCCFYYSLGSTTKNKISKIYDTIYRTDQSHWRNESTIDRFNHIIRLPDTESETNYRIRWIKSRIQSGVNSGIIILKEPPYYLLDIGGATGIFAYSFRDKNWCPYVIDPDKSGIFMQLKYNIPFQAKQYHPNIYGKHFNLITLNYVLEHIIDPEILLEKLKLDMHSGSLLYIEVPDALNFRHKLPEDDIFNSCHFWFFDPISLSALLNRTGFDIVDIHRWIAYRGHYALMCLAKKR